MRITRFSLLLGLACCILFAGAEALAADWPMWRYDASRRAASPQELPAELHLRWVRQYTPREMVWDDPLNQDLMPYDKVFEPVVLGNTLFLGFNDSDKVVALDTDTGKEKWAFYTDGPVRFPPVAWEKKVFFTCDDGYLYCLNAGNGKLVWKVRGGPSERKVLGNKRLISMWPARGGAVLKDGVIYFAASIWPMMGTFIYALDAETGDVIWLNDGTSAQYMLQPHSAPSFAGVAPQGALVAIGDRLLVPGGRSVPACFDLRTGESLYYHLAEYNKTGGVFVCALEDVFFNHHREKVTTLYGLADGQPLVEQIGKHPVLTDKAYYFSGETVSAFNAKRLRKDPENWEASRLWEVPVDASGDLIKAGNRLYAGGGQGITAVDLGDNGRQPQVAWRKVVDGAVERLIAADNKLFAVTLDGRVMAFGSKRKRPRRILDRPIVTEPSMEITRKALSILTQTEVTEGYSLFYGPGDGDLLEALASNSSLHIIAVDPDPDKVERLRRRFDAVGLYGKRIAVHQGDPFTLEAPPYIASLTIVDNLDETKYPRDKPFLQRIFRSMRPYGGIAWITRPEDTAEFSLTKQEMPGLYGRTEKGLAILARIGPLPGAGTWTHNYGDIAQTSKSDDQLVRLPLGILWFGGSSNMDVLPRHGHGPAQQVVGGRLFIEGMDSLSARDVYTGRVIWKAKLPDWGTYGVYYDQTYKDLPTDTRYNQVHIPGANIRGTNFIATDDRVYVIQQERYGGRCHVLDAATGERLDAISLPVLDPNDRRKRTLPWGYIGVYKDKLIGGNGFVTFSDLVGAKKAEYSAKTDFDKSASQSLLVMDRYSGEIIWSVEAKFGFLHNATVVGNDILFCLDKLPIYIEKQLQRRGQPAPTGYRLVALDIGTGKVLWETTQDVFGSFLAYSEEYDVLLQSTRPSRDMTVDEDGQRMIAFRGRDRTLLWDRTQEYKTFPILHNDKIVTEGMIFTLLTGEPQNRINPLTGAKAPWTWKRNYGCNYPIASEHLITFRSGAAGYFDLGRDGGTGSFGGFKSGCTSSLAAADGVLNAPDYTRTCNCSYQNQTSLALVHMPDVEVWTFNTTETGDEPVQRVGINLGAPGDRLADNGTLWLDYPSVGGPSPDVPVQTTPDDTKWFCHHASRFEGEGLSWVAASGGEGVTAIRITLAPQATGTRAYTVRLHFAEPENLRPGQRVFDVALQGQPILNNFDIVAEVGEPLRGIVKEFTGVKVERDLTITLVEAGAGQAHPPVLCGIELVEESS